MTKLSDMQLILLSAASQREDGHFLPLPDSAAGNTAAANKTLAAFVKKGFASEAHTKKAEQTWREDSEWRIGLVITEAGLKAIGAGEADRPDRQPEPTSTPTQASNRKSREGTKQQLVIVMLQHEGGATIQNLVEATGWLPHTTRAVLTGLKKRGFTIDKEKVNGVTHYRITGGKAD